MIIIIIIIMSNGMYSILSLLVLTNVYVYYIHI